MQFKKSTTQGLTGVLAALAVSTPAQTGTPDRLTETFQQERIQFVPANESAIYVAPIERHVSAVPLPKVVEEKREEVPALAVTSSPEPEWKTANQFNDFMLATASESIDAAKEQASALRKFCQVIQGPIAEPTYSVNQTTKSIVASEVQTWATLPGREVTFDFANEKGVIRIAISDLAGTLLKEVDLSDKTPVKIKAPDNGALVVYTTRNVTEVEMLKREKALTESLPN